MLKLLPIFFSLLLLFSCSTTKPKGKTKAEVLYKEAMAMYEDDRFILATEKLNTLRSQFPYSFFATHAELLQADILFKQENYVEAASAYILFKDFHPRHQKISYVMYRIAESFFMQLPSTFDRDLAPAIEAIKHFEALLRAFPKSELAEEARKKIRHCNDLLHKKEKYIADFYYKTDVFDSARHRYLTMINTIPNKMIQDHAMIRVVKSSYELNEFDKCKNYYEKFSSRISDKKKEELSDAYKSCLK